jgi:hypothetical protein
MTSITVRFRGRQEIGYESPLEFLAGMVPADIPSVTSVMLYYSDRSDPGLTVTVDLVRGFRSRPFVTAFADDRSIAEGVASRVAITFGGHGWWQGLRGTELSRFQRMRANASGLGAIALTAAITAVVTVTLTILVTEWLTGHP